MGFFRTLKELGDILVDSGREFNEIFRDAGDEFRELTTDGFKEMVIKKNSDYKTSFQKNEMAYDLISEAEDRIEREIKSFQSKAKQTSKKVEAFNLLKLSVQQKEVSEWLNMLESNQIDFDKFSSEKYKQFNKLQFLSLAEIKELQKQGDQIINSTNSRLGERPTGPSRESEMPFPILITSPLLTIPTAIYKMKQQRKRVEQADAYLEEAERYSQKAFLAVEKMKVKKMELTEVNRKIKEGETLLSMYSQLLKGMLDDLNQVPKEDPSLQSKMEISYLLVSAIYTVSLIQLVTKEGKVSKKAEQLHKTLNQYETEFENMLDQIGGENI
ncbi:hypothetical protein J7I93_13700 [Bacillus sp. ISL-47]|uniref:hypothetical protein n=1 Tax=Bacillus sp. ISL-47 TaxID=2819130 RepID=UPI001BE6A4FC|nr:hypothetical protein [Bacillus sp. ISL-47]MBT2689241.1 hypothetical protein [Bacillus sp. ISL-47]MBT2708634.1 hypothetical protein [Pseudomonas sp. ISL-84]